MDNDIITRAVAALADNEKEAKVQEAKNLIAAIAQSQREIAKAQENITECREKLRKLDFKPKTAEDLLG